MSSEPQTPMLPFAENIISKKKLPQGRALLTQEHGQSTLYAGNLLRYFLHKHGVFCKNVVFGEIGSSDVFLYRFESPYTLAEVVQKSLEFSNNFIANQIFLSMGAKKFGAPATLEKGVKAAKAFAIEKLDIKDLQIVEGSGLSRLNKITAAQMMLVLKKFQPHRQLMKEKNGVWFKTGTLKGVRCLVGYYKDGDPDMTGRFVIFINTPGGSAQKVLDAALKAAVVKQP